MISGTHCESCKALLEEVCREVPNVRSCAVDYRTGRTVVEHDGDIDWAAFERAVSELGSQYRVELPPAASGVK